MFYDAIIVQIYVLSSKKIDTKLDTEKKESTDMADIVLKNDRLCVEIMEPGREYRGSRYDWTGIVKQVTLEGEHTFFLPEQIEGMGGRGLVGVYEFRDDTLYKEAELADRSPLIGVGLLKKPDPDNFCFWRAYDVLPFHRTWSLTEKGVTFETFPQLCQGVAIRQTKELILEDNALVIRQTIRNVGQRAVALQEFNHNFFCFDNAPIDKNYVLKLPYKPMVDVRRGRISLGYGDLSLDEMDPGDDTAAFVLHGYEKLQGSSFALENRAVGLGVSVEEDFDSIRSYNWVCRKAFCPETFCGLDLEPGEEKTFTRKYTFYKT